MTVWSRRLSPAGTTRSRLSPPGTRRTPVGVGHLLRTVTYRIAQVDQDLVEGGRRLMPFELFCLVGRRGFAGPQVLQGRDV